MASAGSSSQKSNSWSGPWAEQQPYLKELYEKASRLNQGDRFQYFPDSTVTPQSGWTKEALQGQASRARAGSPLVKSAQDQNRRTTSGEMLNANPYRDAMFDQAARGVKRNYAEALNMGASRFGGAGRYGTAMAPSGGLWNQQSYADYQLGDTLNRLATSVYSDDYGRERGYQEAAVARAPGLADYDYADFGRLREAGAGQESFEQMLLDDAIARFDFNQNEPWERLGMYSNLIGAPVSSSKASSKASSWNASILWG